MKFKTSLLVGLALLMTGGTVLPAAAEESGAPVTGEPSEIVQYHRDAKWEDEGLAVYAAQWDGCELRMFFDISNGGKVGLRFKIPLYEEDSAEFRSEGDVYFTKYAYDIIIKNFTTGAQNAAILRLWGDSGKDPSSAVTAARICLGEDYLIPEDEYTSRLAEEVWVEGVMRESSEFYIEFDATNGFSGTFGDTGQFGPLLTVVPDAVPNGGEVLSSIREVFAGCDTVQVIIRPSNPEEKDDLINRGKFILTEIDGQPLANENGVLQDTVAPFLAPIEVRRGAEIVLGKEYDIEIKGSPLDSATSPIYLNYASDVLSYERLTYRVKVTSPTGIVKQYDTLEGIVFDEIGTNKLEVTATDLGGNSYTTPAVSLDVVRGFVLAVENVPTEGKVGEKIQLPAGTATDPQGNLCEVTVTAEDPYTKRYEVKDGAFTPDKAGVWIVTYRSQTADGSKQESKQFRITVTEGSKKKGCGGEVGAGMLLVAAAPISGLILCLKRRSYGRTHH